jgi:protease-4
MTDSDTGSNQDSSQSTEQQQKVVDRLVFAALTEQRRARRWRVFFMLFFIVYLSVVTITLMSAGDPGAGVAGKADGEQHTALVKLSGVIADDEPGGSKNVLSGLRKAFEHEDTAGIVIEINSPGGSPVQSAYIFDEIMRLKQEHESVPVYAVVTDIAASGGYFVAAAADRIYVNKSSLVGSIGVRLDAFGFVDMMKKLGIERRLLTAGDNKALFETQDLFSGLIWSGEQSVKLGLADAYGTTRSVARELEAEEVVDFTPKTDLLERIADRIGSSAGQRISELLFDGLSMN